MKNGILGIDLGTSGIKLLYNDAKGTHKIRESYTTRDPDGWWKALCKAARQLDFSQLRAIGLSAQVGTYIINGRDYIGWSDPVGQEELQQTLEHFSQQDFLEEISMPHPQLPSYPLPRLRYIQNHFKPLLRVRMPKDFLIDRLTGHMVSDMYSWRGLANLKTGTYSRRLLQWLGLDEACLPKLQPPDTVAGLVSPAAARETGIPLGTPVFTGCNDFFAGLLGTGMLQGGELFDITGTSEHLGVVTDRLAAFDSALVSGPYFGRYVQYGVTASSGAALRMGMLLHNLHNTNLNNSLQTIPPVFLPYLNGERSPIWDANAKGVFFGINADTTAETLSYSVLEGVAFSLYHIYEQMGCPDVQAITVVGGAGKNPVLNRIKATLFGLPVRTLQQNDVSALGAQILAAIGMRLYDDLEQAVFDNCEPGAIFRPDPTKTRLLRNRFAVYKQLYPSLKPLFTQLTSGGASDRPDL